MKKEKKFIVFLFLCALIMVIISLCACGSNERRLPVSVTHCGFDGITLNEHMIMDALNTDNYDDISTIIGVLNSVKVGNIKSATQSTENNDKVLDVVSEDGAKYRIYLTGNLTVEAVKNMDTGEWVITSSR